VNTIKVPYEVLEKSMRADEKFEVLPCDHFLFDDFRLEIMDFKNKYGESFKWSFDVHYKGIDYWKQSDNWKSAGIPIMRFSAYEDGDPLGKYACNVVGGEWFQGDVDIFRYDGEECISEGLKHEMLAMILFYMGYIMNYPRDRKQTRVSSHKYSREYRLSTKQNRIYLFSDILKYVSDTYVPEGQHHSIQCPCWEVRGHYRHYKSGKVVFIPAYKKGKQRDKVEPKPKEYYV
jgi:hypothetical protein